MLSWDVIAAELKLHNSALGPARARPLSSSYFITMTVLVSQRPIMRRIKVPGTLSGYVPGKSMVKPGKAC